MTFHSLPTLNAMLNTVSAVLLLAGFFCIKRGHREWHKRIMLAAFSVSILFFISYLTYHFRVGSVPYPFHDWTRILYFSILIPHILLAFVLVPGVFLLLWFSWNEKFDRHRRLAKWVWPIWMFISITGVVIYLMLHF